MKKSSSKKWLVFVLATAVLIGAGIGLLMYNSKNRTYQMEGPSMRPTLSDGDMIKVRVVPAENVQRGDIIVFESPATRNGRQVKRVVGLPGDTVAIANGELVVTKPDKTVYKPYVSGETPGNSSVIVKPSSFYVIGDDRQNSIDSRLDSFGQVPFESLLGVAKL